MPTLSDTNLVALEPESGRQLQDVVGLTASQGCVSSYNIIYRRFRYQVSVCLGKSETL